ncbi:phosphate transport system substrate-binding protein [Filomicrobium insigne]|uniref:Phosphate transport system substrate-binding protein n=1 Tax=Filomicrobium insigne TaxID=418854 RepID=A0A1H0NGI3_9HYPH|nr:phosphate ABC transporter substrate-binding/OmpA family protein [Filomicrobium insigne]SDO91430.1 phosphate transport system substrate-binding protein [Filomicrobium insigne]
MMPFRIPASIAACLLLGLSALSAHAGSFRATLTSGVEVVGDIVDFHDGYYDFQVGETLKRIKVEDVSGLSLVELTAARTGDRPSGDNVVPAFTLEKSSGQPVAGQIVQFQDGYYTVATATGTVQVPVSEVTKIALAWQEASEPKIAEPSVAKLSGTLRIRATAEGVERVVPEILQFYAKASGQTGKWSPRQADGSRIYNVGFSGEREGLRIELQADDPISAVAAVLAGNSDIAVLPAELTTEELAAVAAKVPEGVIRSRPAAVGSQEAAPAKIAIELTRLGPSGAVVIVNADNPIEKLSYDQVSGIFSGKITDWSQLGGQHRRIRVHSLAQHSGLKSIAKRTVLKGGDLMLSAYQVDTLSELAEIVSTDPTAIGLTEAASVGNTKALKIVDQCGTARAPDEFTLKLHSYPLSDTYAVYSLPDANSQTKEFRNFLKADLTQSFLKSRGLPNDRVVAVRSPGLSINTEVGAGTSATNAANKQDAIERVSTVFGFASGSVTPMDGSEKKVDGLKTFLDDRDGEKRRIAVVGFSDAIGTLDQNIAVSSARARSIQSLLSQHGIKAEKILALGPMFPIACEVNPGGAELNRRVEIWLY